LTDAQKDDLVAFLNALTGDATPVRAPEKLPQSWLSSPQSFPQLF
jgi:hypothetical protein